MTDQELEYQAICNRMGESVRHLGHLEYDQHVRYVKERYNWETLKSFEDWLIEQNEKVNSGAYVAFTCENLTNGIKGVSFRDRYDTKFEMDEITSDAEGLWFGVQRPDISVNKEGRWREFHRQHSGLVSDSGFDAIRINSMIYLDEAIASELITYLQHWLDHRTLFLGDGEDVEYVEEDAQEAREARETSQALLQAPGVYHLMLSNGTVMKVAEEGDGVSIAFQDVTRSEFSDVLEVTARGVTVLEHFPDLYHSMVGLQYGHDDDSGD